MVVKPKRSGRKRKKILMCGMEKMLIGMVLWRIAAGALSLPLC